MKNSQRGFTSIVILLIIAVLAVISGVYYYNQGLNNNSLPNQINSTLDNRSTKDQIGVCSNLEEEYNFSQCDDDLAEPSFRSWCENGYDLKKPTVMAGTYRFIYTDNTVNFDGKGKACVCIVREEEVLAEMSGKISDNQISWTNVNNYGNITDLPEESSVLELWNKGKFASYLLVNHGNCPSTIQLKEADKEDSLKTCACK